MRKDRKILRREREEEFKKGNKCEKEEVDIVCVGQTLDLHYSRTNL